MYELIKDEERCIAKTTKGSRCRRYKVVGDYCIKHWDLLHRKK